MILQKSYAYGFSGFHPPWKKQKILSPTINQKHILSSKTFLHFTLFLLSSSPFCPILFGSLPVLYLSLTFPLPVPYLSLTCPLPVPYLSLTCPLPVPYLSLTCPLPVPYLSLTLLKPYSSFTRLASLCLIKGQGQTLYLISYPPTTTSKLFVL